LGPSPLVGASDLPYLALCERDRCAGLFCSVSLEPDTMRTLQYTLIPVTLLLALAPVGFT